MSLKEGDSPPVQTDDLLQGEFGEVRLPTIRSKGVIRLIENRSPAERLEDAATQLACFRQREQRLRGYRLLREARLRYPACRVGRTELYNMTGRDEALAREAVAKVEAKFRRNGLVLLIINEGTCLADTREAIPIKSLRSERFWSQVWRHRRIDLGCIFVPATFRDDEHLFCDRSTLPETERLCGRSALIYQLLIQVFWSLASWDNPRWLRARMAKWKIDLQAAPEAIAVQLFNRMTES